MTKTFKEFLVESSDKLYYHGTKTRLPPEASLQVRKPENGGTYGTGVYFYDSASHAKEWTRKGNTFEGFIYVCTIDGELINGVVYEQYISDARKHIGRKGHKDLAMSRILEDGYVGVNDGGLVVIFDDSVITVVDVIAINEQED